MEKVLKILLLEDSHTDAELIQRLLIKEVGNCEFNLTMNKKDFLKALDEFIPDVILSDNSLPSFNATEALKIVRDRSLHIPFILITGTVSEEFAAGIIKQGADDYILKDRMARLPSAIDLALRYRETEREKLATTEKLILSEQKYRTIFFKSPLPKWIYDAETLRFLEVNEAAVSHYGYTAAEFQQMTIKDIRPIEDINDLLLDISEIRNEPDFRRGNWRHLKKNGQEIIVETLAHSIEYNSQKARMVVINDITEKRKAEENFRIMMERISDAFVAIDSNWNYTYVNSRASEIMGKKSSDLLGKNIWTEFPESIDQPFHKAYHKALEEQRYIYLEEYYPPFGAWLENHIYPSPEGLSIFFRNITDRKKSEQKIIQSEENLKAIFDNSSEGFVLLDREGLVKSYNERAVKSILINTNEEIKIGKSIYDFVETHRRDFFRNTFSRVLDGEVIQYDRSYYKNDGEITWINFSFNPVRKGNDVKGICITGRDITEKKLREQQREFDHNNLTALINNTRDLMWSVDRSFKLITFNQAFERVVKLMSDINLIKGVDILAAAFNEHQLQRYKKYYERAFAGEIFTEIEYNSSPTEFWSEISFYPIYERNMVIGTACFSKNITERKKSEEKLRQLSQEKLESKVTEQKRITRVMLSTQERERNAIGVELHDNVNQILVGTNLMLSMVKGDPVKYHNLIATSIEQLQGAIEENRKIAHVFVAPDLEAESLVSQLEKLLNSMLKTSGVEIVFNSERFREEALDNERKFNIYRIAQEQCTNIVKYARATIVRVLLETSADSFQMIISDNGVGMDSSKKANGIGLRNIKNRLDLFDGMMTINTDVAKGFSLEVSIPLANKL